MNDAPAPDPSTTPRRSRLAALARLVTGTIVVASVVFWVWAFSPWTPRDNPDRLDDPAFARAAEPVCADAQAAIGELPGPFDGITPAERADQIEAGTLVVEDLLTRLEELAPLAPAGHDADLVARWLADWNTYLDDRWRHVERLRAATPDTPERDLRFLVSGELGPVNARMDAFARLNRMDSCQTPGDV